jgi:hemolysin activation/secretion protein
VHGEVAYSRPVISALTVAARGGGKHVLGDTPYYEAAYIGGAGTLRGFPSQRFAGDSALFGSAELRVPMPSAGFFPRGSVGVFGLCDAGRVFLDGEPSDRWHVSTGGGLWLARPGSGNALSLSVASGEGTRVYVQSRLWF